MVLPTNAIGEARDYAVRIRTVGTRFVLEGLRVRRWRADR